MLLLLRSHRLSLSLPPHFTTPKKSILFFKKVSSTRCYVVWYLLCRCALCGGRCDGLCNNTYTTRWDRHLNVAGGKSSCPSDAFPFIPTGQHALSLSVDLKTMDEKTGFGLALDPLLLNSCSVGNRMTTWCHQILFLDSLKDWKKQVALFYFLTRTAFSSSPGTNLDDVRCETSSRYELEAPVPFLLFAVGIFSMLCCSSHKQQAGLVLGKRVLSSEGKQRLS